MITTTNNNEENKLKIANLKPYVCLYVFIWGDEAIQRRPNHDRRDAANTAETMTTDMESMLCKLQAIIEAMSSMIPSSSSSLSSTNNGSNIGGMKGPTSHTLQRHSEILHDYQQEFRKTRNSIVTLNKHSELISGNSNGMDENNNSISIDMNGKDDNGNGLDALYKERGSISSATQGADNAIATGLSLKEDLDRQRAMFASMVERMESMSEGIPAVNRLIGQIKRKKKRDVLIICIIISTLLFITFSWKVL